MSDTYRVGTVTQAVASVERNIALRTADAEIHPVSAAGFHLILKLAVTQTRISNTSSSRLRCVNLYNTLP